MFLSGASVLALEILGTRILGPFYGVSIFLWSALITVTLAALSVGYAVGGRLADRGPIASRLAWILVASGLWVLLIPWMTRPMLGATESLGLRAAVLVTATLLFAPPLTLLGMVSPYAIRLKASKLEHVGQTAGDLYAISTAASVASALAMGFLLIPSLGVLKLTYAIGIALLVAAGIAGFASRGSGVARAAIPIALMLGGSAAVAALPEEQADPERGLLAVRQSPYCEIRVVEQYGARHLLIDGGIHSMVDPNTWQSWHPYVPPATVPRFLFEEPGEMLLMGLGGGSLAKFYAGEGWTIDAVEIDRAVAEVAQEFFGLRDDECEIFFDDGRRFLDRATKRYDLMLVDVFGSSSIPFHLVTREAFGLMASRLAPGGVLAMNIETVGWDDPLVGSIAASLSPHFEHLLVLPCDEPPNAIGNLIVLAANREITFDEYAKLERPYDFLGQEHKHWTVKETNHAWDNRFEPEFEGSVPVTDDLNWLDLRSEEINLVARKDLHEYFRDTGLGW